MSGGNSEAAIVLLVLGLPAFLWVAWGLYVLIRRLRHSLLDLCVLVWATGVLSGLPLLALPKDVPLAAAVSLAAVIGALVFGGGVLGLAAANRIGRDSAGARMLLQLRGLLFLPALAGLLALPFLVIGGFMGLAGDEKTAGGAALGAAVVCLILAWHGWRFLKLLRRKPAEAVAVTAAAPAPIPSDLSDRSDRSDGTGAPPTPPVEPPR